MSEQGQELFDMMRAVNEGQASMLKLGRQQMALEVIRWLEAHAPLYEGHLLNELAELCKREAANAGNGRAYYIGRLVNLSMDPR